MMLPLNGTKTHPLSEHAWSALGGLVRGPRPAQEVNPGVINRLEREGMAERMLALSPYPSHKKINHRISWLRITLAGLSKLRERQRPRS